MTPSRTRREILLANDLKELERLDAFAHEIGGARGLDKDQIFALSLCLEEAVANIIMHGSKSERPATHIQITIQERMPLVASIKDDGAPFDPTIVPAPVMAASLPEAQPGGLGVHIIRQFTSSMRYERVDDSNHLVLEFTQSGKPVEHE